jgi:hypothetical protein
MSCRGKYIFTSHLEVGVAVVLSLSLFLLFGLCDVDLTALLSSSLHFGSIHVGKHCCTTKFHCKIDSSFYCLTSLFSNVFGKRPDIFSTQIECFAMFAIHKIIGSKRVRTRSFKKESALVSTEQNTSMICVDCCSGIEIFLQQKQKYLLSSKDPSGMRLTTMTQGSFIQSKWPATTIVCQLSE